MGVGWSTQLSKRLQILNRVYPILQIKDYPKRSPRFRELVDVYDPLAVVFLVIENIADTFDISAINEMTIQHHRLVNSILPFLKSIDAKRGQQVEESKQIEYIEAIIERLCSPDEEFHQVSYIDPELNIRYDTLAILHTHTQKNNVINYRLEHGIINLLANIGNDIPLDDQVEYNKLILQKQIEDKKLDRAMQIMERQIKDSRSYYSRVITIIEMIRQNYESDTWREKQRGELERVEEHLEEWVLWQAELLEMINTYFFDITQDQINEYVQIKKLKNLISDAHGIFVRLFGIVKDARETFYEEHFRQALFISKLPSNLVMDNQVMESAVQAPVTVQDNLTEILFNNYSHMHPPKIHSIQNLTSYLFTDYTRSSSRKIKREKDEDQQPIERFEKFSDSMVNHAKEILESYLKDRSQGSIIEFLQYAQQHGVAYTYIVIILLGLQIREISPKSSGFEHVSVQTDGEFEMNFDGNSISGTNIILELDNND